MPRGCAITLLALSTLVGLILALLAMAALVLNETQTDVAGLARASRPIRADDPAAPPGALVSLTGTISADEPLGDELFLAPGQYLAVERVVEMYAWEKYRDGEDSNGRPRYNERRVWTRSPDRGLRDNPPMPFKGGAYTAAGAHIGEMPVALAGADLPVARRLALHEELLRPDTQGVVRDDYLYIGSGPSSRPHIGDLRVSYMVVPAQQLVTVFAALEGGQLGPYRAADGQAILLVVPGERAAALREVAAVQQLAGWMLRLGAAGALWLGLLLLLAGSRRLVDWPGWLRLTAGSARLASVLGLATVILTVASLWGSRGSLPVLAAALGLEALVAGGWALRRRMRRPQLARAAQG